METARSLDLSFELELARELSPKAVNLSPGDVMGRPDEAGFAVLG
jgi:hypothetical protein